MNCPTAIAKLIEATPSPVAEFSGDRKRPRDCRAPIVTIRMPAADSVIAQMAGWLSVRNIVGPILLG